MRETDEMKELLREIKDRLTRIEERQNEQYTDLMLKLTDVTNALTSVEIEPYDEELYYEEAEMLVIEYQVASTSLLQRMLGIGFSRASRLVDMLEERGIVASDKEPGTPRKVLKQPPRAGS
jgi:S-DNA-T family DNA segregation ATPase FtsK/SpoIIIE